MKNKIASLVFVLVVAGTSGAVFIHRQYINDQYIVLTNSLEPQSAELLPSLELTEKGTFYYKASRPLVQSKQDFNNSCGGVVEEHTIVLGCYTGQRFYVYNVMDERLNGVKQVTAAHELLHAVYERLSDSYKESLNRELLSTAASIKDDRFSKVIEQYKASAPDQFENELHALLGTEIAVLPQSLEDHYNSYFKNRSKIVSFAQQYESLFIKNEEQMQQYDQKLAALKAEINILENTVDQRKELTVAKRAELDELQRTNNIEEYNNAVPDYNKLVESYNSALVRLKSLLSEYNTLVAERNELATSQNSLFKQLDSTYEPISQ